MASYIPYQAAMDPLGLAMGQGLGAGLLQGIQNRRLTSDTDALLEYLRNMQMAQQYGGMAAGTAVGGPLGGAMGGAMQPDMSGAVAAPRLKTPQMQQMLLQMELGKMMNPEQQAQINLMGAQADYYRARGFGESNPAMSGSDTTIAQVQDADGTFHNVLVNKVTGETIRDLGPATPKDTGMETPLAARKLTAEAANVEGQNELYDATRQERIVQQQLQTQQQRLSLLNAIEERQGQLPPAMRREKAELEFDQAKQDFAKGQQDLDFGPLKKNLLEAQIAETQAKVAAAGDKASQANTLRSEFNANPVVRNFYKIQYANKLMQDAYEGSIKGNRIASDQALGVLFQKVLDPESVVRESEYARTPVGAAALNRIRSIPERLLRGGLALKNDDRQALLTIANQAVGASKEQMNEHIDRYEKLSKDFGVNRDLVFGTIKRFDDGQQATRITSDAEYDALPSGAQFEDPNGVLRRKP